MTRARSLSKLSNPSTFTVDTDNNVGINSTSPTERLDVVGVVSATSFFGDGSGLTGVASTDNIITGTAATFTGGIVAAQSDVSVRNLTGVAATFTGVLTYEDVTNVDSLGIVTARGGAEFGASGVGGTITATGQAEFAGVVTATKFVGDGSELTGVVSGIELQFSGASVGAAITNVNLVGFSSVTAPAAGLSTITAPSAAKSSGIANFLGR